MEWEKEVNMKERFEIKDKMLLTFIRNMTTYKVAIRKVKILVFPLDWSCPAISI